MPNIVEYWNTLFKVAYSNYCTDKCNIEGYDFLNVYLALVIYRITVCSSLAEYTARMLKLYMFLLCCFYVSDRIFCLFQNF